MMIINVKVNVKVRNSTFSKKAKKVLFSNILKQIFVMFPEYTYKPTDILTKIIKELLKIISNRLKELMYEGQSQGHKLSSLK